MNNQENYVILTLTIPKELKKDLDILTIRYEKTVDELLIPLLKNYVTSKNTKISYTKQEWKELVDDLDGIFNDKKKEKPKKITRKQINDLFKDDNFWDD